MCVRAFRSHGFWPALCLMVGCRERERCIYMDRRTARSKCRQRIECNLILTLYYTELDSLASAAYRKESAAVGNTQQATLRSRVRRAVRQCRCGANVLHPAARATTRSHVCSSRRQRLRVDRDTVFTCMRDAAARMCVRRVADSVLIDAQRRWMPHARADWPLGWRRAPRGRGPPGGVRTREARQGAR